MIVELKKLAKEFIELSKKRDEFNENDCYEGAFEIECDQRDVGYSMACLIENMKGCS